MTNVTVQEALNAAIEVIEQAIPDKRGEFEEQQKLYENYPNLAYKYDYLKVEADEMQQALDNCKAALAEIEKCEPVAWMDNFGTIVSAKWQELYGDGTIYNIPIYTSPQPRDWVSLTTQDRQAIIKASPHGLDRINATEAKCKQLNTKG